MYDIMCVLTLEVKRLYVCMHWDLHVFIQSSPSRSVYFYTDLVLENFRWQIIHVCQSSPSRSVYFYTDLVLENFRWQIIHVCI